MEAQFVGSRTALNDEGKGVTPQLLFARERFKHEIIIFAYRTMAILVGVTMILVGYLLFSSLVIDTANSRYYYQELTRVAPGLFFIFIGLIFCVVGITKIMPLPEFEKPFLEETKNEAQSSDDNIPVLYPITLPRLNDKLWSNNVRPIITKVANNESLSSSERDLLKNWLRTV